MNAPDFSRRGFFHRIALGAAVANAALSSASRAQTPPPGGPFTLPPLPYAFDVNYPVAMGGEPLADLDGGIPGLPTSFLIGRDGRIHERHVGAGGIDSLELKARGLLQASSGVLPPPGGSPPPRRGRPSQFSDLTSSPGAFRNSGARRRLIRALVLGREPV